MRARNPISTAAAALGWAIPLAGLCAALSVVGGWAAGIAPHYPAGYPYQQASLWQFAQILWRAHSSWVVSIRAHLGLPVEYAPARYLSWLSQMAPALPYVAGAGAALGALAGGWLGWRWSTPRADEHEAGRTVERGPAAARAESAAEHRVSGAGIRIHPHLRISRDRETRGIELTGSPGSGKTVVIKSLLREILNDKHTLALIHDIKGDFTAELGSIVDPDEFGVVGPWDARAMRWSAASDLRSAADARELAARLVPAPTSGSSQWAQGAQQILGGLLVTLARQTKGRWTWADLQVQIAAPYPEMRAAPIVGGLLPEKPTATTASYLANLTAAAGGLVADLAAADDPARPRWSVRAWLAGRGPRVIVMQGSTRFSALAQAVNSSIVRAISGSLDSMPDSRERRVWLVLDELAQLGKIELGPVIETGRSKGICTILGWQDVGQRRALYGHDVADSWDSMIGTHIVCRLLGPDAQEWSSSLVGRRQIRRQVRTASGDAAIGGMSRDLAWAKNVSISEQFADEVVIRPEEFAALGPSREGVEAILVTGGQTAHRLTWPYPKGWHGVAPPHIPASWTRVLEIDDSDPAAAESDRTAAPSRVDRESSNTIYPGT